MKKNILSDAQRKIMLITDGKSPVYSCIAYTGI